MELDSVPEALLRVDASSGLIVAANRWFRARIASHPNLTSGLNLIKDLVKDLHRKRVQKALRAALDEDKIVELECDVLVVACTTEFPQHHAHQLQVVRDTSTPGVVVITLRRPTGEVFERQQNDDLYDYVMNAPIALQWLSENGNVLWANQTALDLLGYTAEEYLGKHITEWSNDSVEELTKNFTALMQGATLRGHSSDWRTKSGEVRHVVLDSNIHFGPDGKCKNTRCFIRDDTARQIQQARLDAEKDSAIASMHFQDHFLRKVLHEIRTPCNIVLQSLETTDVEAQMQKLLRIVKDVEDAHAFESGKALDLRPSKFNLPALVREIFWRQADGYASPDVQRSVALADGSSGGGGGSSGGGAIPCDVVTDRTCLVRVLTHLIDNAMRFTRVGFVRLELGYRAGSSRGSGSSGGGSGGSGAGAAVMNGSGGSGSAGAAVMNGNGGSSGAKVVANGMKGSSGSSGSGVGGGGSRGRVSFAVINTGKHLDTELVHHHFQKYWTGSSAQTGGRRSSDANLFGEDGEGIGVGLNICFNIIQCLGSELVVTSENGVNTFRFELDVPVATTVADFNFARPEEGYMRKERQDRSPSLAQRSRWIDVEDAPASAMHVLDPRAELPPEPPAAATACVAGRQEPKRPHILVVEDNTICQKVLCRTLRSLDCTTAVAGNGKIACELVRSGATAFDLILMDLRMPVCDGLQATAIMRRELEVETPIVALSADSTEDIRQRCSAAGMQSFCSKPASKQEIAQVVKKFVVR